MKKEQRLIKGGSKNEIGFGNGYPATSINNKQKRGKTEDCKMRIGRSRMCEKHGENLGLKVRWGDHMNRKWAMRKLGDYEKQNKYEIFN